MGRQGNARWHGHEKSGRHMMFGFWRGVVMSMYQMLTMDAGELSAFQGIRAERLIPGELCAGHQRWPPLQDCEQFRNGEANVVCRPFGALPIDTFHVSHPRKSGRKSPRDNSWNVAAHLAFGYRQGTAQFRLPCGIEVAGIALFSLNKDTRTKGWILL